MAIVNETTAKRIQVLDNGVNVTHIMESEIGVLVWYESSVLSRTEHDNVSQAVDDITARGLIADASAASSIPTRLADGAVNPRHVAIRKRLGIPLVEIDFTNDSGFASFMEPGSTSAQPNGRQTTINSDPNNLVASGFSEFLVMRPGIKKHRESTLLLDDFGTAGAASVRVEIEYGSCGVLESSDTLRFYLITDEGEKKFKSESGDISQTSMVRTIRLTSETASIRIVSKLGEGTVEGHVINSIKVY